MALLLALLGPIWNALSRAFSWILRRADVTVEVEFRYGVQPVEATTWSDGADGFAFWVPVRFRVLNHSHEKSVRISRVRCDLPHRWRYSEISLDVDHQENLGQPISGGDFSPWIGCIWSGWGRHKKGKLPKDAKIVVETVGARHLHHKIRLIPFSQNPAHDVPAQRISDPDWSPMWRDGHHYELRWDTQNSLCDLTIFHGLGGGSRFAGMQWDEARTFILNVPFLRPRPVMVVGPTSNPYVITAGVTADGFRSDLDTVLLLTGIQWS